MIPDERGFALNQDTYDVIFPRSNKMGDDEDDFRFYLFSKTSEENRRREPLNFDNQGGTRRCPR